MIRIDAVKKEEMRRKERTSDIKDRKALKWFGDLKRMSKERITKEMYDSNVKGLRSVGRLCRRWFTGVKNEHSARSLELRNAKVKCMDIQ